MADRPQVHQVQVHPQQRYDVGVKGILPHPSTSQILVVITLLPIGATLLGLAGITLVGALLGLAVATPLFLLCSPVLVPAAILLAGAVTGFLTSGAFGLTGLSSLSWVLSCIRQATGQEPLEYAKRQMQEAAIQVGEKTKQVGETIGDTTKQAGEAIKSKGQEDGAAEVTTTST